MGELQSDKINRPFSRKDIFMELRGIVDITEREISYWMDLGLIVPDIANPQGQGKTRYHSFYNLVDFGVAKKLALAGIKLSTIGAIMRDIISPDRKAIYLSEEEKRLIVINTTSGEMYAGFEGLFHIPPEASHKGVDESAREVRATAEALRRHAKQSGPYEIILVPMEFESVFVLNITPLVKRLLG
jgi:DNA-binding transcriptional MerR regulator